MNKCALITILLLASISSVFIAEAKIVDEHVCIVPAEGTDRKTLEAIRDGIPADLPISVKADIWPEEKVPESAHDQARHQYDAHVVLDSVYQGLILDRRVETALIVVDVDLYTPELNFVFGIADIQKKACVISLSRLRNEFYGRKPDDKLFIGRAVKEAVHELGHVWGLEHCNSPKCVMYFSNSLADTDKKRNFLCIACRNKLYKHFVSPIIKR